jgi:predicted amidophosphoribosyltransferase
MNERRAYREAAMDLLFGLCCVGCGHPGAIACPGCRAALELLPRRTDPTPRPAGLPPVYSVGAYDGAIRAMLLGYKEDAKLALARPLSAALARSCAAIVAEYGAGLPAVRLVELPTPASRIRDRGHDPLGALTGLAARQLRRAGIDARRWPALRITRQVADQSGLNELDRHSNLDGAFEVRAWAARGGVPVIVVDDIVTTGSSALAASAALTAHSETVLGVAVIAATARRMDQA